MDFTGADAKPTKDHILFSSWKRCNNFLVSWLLKLISPSTVFYMNDALQIWEKLASRFSQPDGVRICHLQQVLNTVVQGRKSIDEYIADVVDAIKIALASSMIFNSKIMFSSSLMV
ncbi:hypothetical protein L6164_023656 [Bauhinia variegata]|uniref:Uncharacterized protein n=1 Tax=Bauhinia variegata TaxID=167791 RepID=A0ACB9MKH7_BAUVA|nr:hypothetical protein L6164_023656 [Bauhinia variegata]